ncbi:MAG: LacI family DNA-binding transcriptional regulator [Granulosicoccus sp.]
MKSTSTRRADSHCRVTLKDVARLAEVSEISVSRVMRDAPNISEKLRNKVMLAANSLGYTPNRVAGALKNNNSKLVAVVLPSMSNEVFPQVLNGIETVLAQHGLNAVLGLSEYDSERELRVIRELLSWSPMGIVLTGLHHDETVAKMIAQQNIPVVQIMDIDGEAIQSAVGISHSKAAQAAADYLVKKGYKKPAYIGAWSERPVRSRTRRLAFEARLEVLGVPLVSHKIANERSSALVGAQTTTDLLSEHPDLDCIFYANDDLALGGLFHAMKAGMSIPDELAILGFNGLQIGRATPIQLSSVETPRFEMGTRAAELLLALETEGSQIIDLDFKIFSGGST